ncbi:YppF family protein [Litchfieldia salsa]|uniref:YppF-like protein n=1 Tax=Litchfieldia salsa TaxID=930152 RepID=A0A1H0TJG3_9BACI|nr:YppF family protein [Litchfieldia salsa]SDP54163.1 YppF-like protein [Litchfieldia salsa]
MLIQDLRNTFIAVKKYEPMDTNELLDFARQQYLFGHLTILQYRNVIKLLENEGARKPQYVLEDLY